MRVVRRTSSSNASRLPARARRTRASSISMGSSSGGVNVTLTRASRDSSRFLRIFYTSTRARRLMKWMSERGLQHRSDAGRDEGPDGQRGRGGRTGGVQDVDLPGSLLDPEVLDERAVRVESLGADAGAGPLEIVFHYFRHETL